MLLSIRGLLCDEKQVEGLSEPVRQLSERRRKVVWLETLDMEPLAEGTNLFAAILARVGAKLEAVRGRYSPMGAILDDRDRYQRAIDALHQVQTNVVRIWDGTFRTRAAHVDPQAFAAEVIESERAGIDLSPPGPGVRPPRESRRPLPRTGGRQNGALRSRGSHQVVASRDLREQPAESRQLG